ncbi:MAG TPA: inositol oxygenase family protein [Blastocatellia bacterium]|nr:inositol oxygenase family protein [Blastocatellia bacterium]HMX28207.1 inositol oxygenase family protein [Blastocatellia bacterium]HMZ18793.1 inositol oxygenase family protein [Blastocatellia bacterium]HNG29840.1 inositol oxygenase family protein [Blastocatellia bacterium]
MSIALHPHLTAADKSFLDNISNTENFRNYAAEARDCVKELYYLNHKHQTLDFVLSKKAEYGKLDKMEMGVWEALEKMNEFVDDSDPDLALPQIVHALQTAEAIRQDGHPRWFILAGLIHDLGKMLHFFGEPQWAIVGDTFPVGCAWSDKIVYSEFFAENPDSQNPAYQTPNGIYQEGCGLDNVHISWGHDEYLYLVTKDYLPQEALWMLRYHSCYPVHREGAYQHLLSKQDEELLYSVRAFNPYDLYSKCDTVPDVEALRPFYQELIAEYFPARIKW